MRDFNELNWFEGAETVLALFERLTVMRSVKEEEPVKLLLGACNALMRGNIREAVDMSFSMTGALLMSGCRRVTGDLFKDFLLSEIFLKPHPFAIMSAANRLDEAVYNSMKDDLDILYALKDLSGETLGRFIQERYRELKQKLHPNRDLAARRAEAAWGGGSVRPEEDAKPTTVIPAFLPSGDPNWHYGEEEMRDSFVSDEALEEMYHRFIEAEPDWSSLTEDLWNFFAAYGCGDFLRVRHFAWEDGKLIPIGEIRPKDDRFLPEGPYRTLIDHAISFMRGETMEPMLLSGADGAGKTAMLFALTDELPEMRFVYASGVRCSADLTPVFNAVKDQPLKFLVALDEPELKGLAMRLIPANVLLAVARKANMSGFSKIIAM
ncbi:MAG: hypothetical protein J5854_07510 [Clostridia bacterium]|nr:hypothetical protein [Clostridia bacterium]